MTKEASLFRAVGQGPIVLLVAEGKPETPSSEGWIAAIDLVFFKTQKPTV